MLWEMYWMFALLWEIYVILHENPIHSRDQGKYSITLTLQGKED